VHMLLLFRKIVLGSSSLRLNFSVIKCRISARELYVIPRLISRLPKPSII
jgi:hypothetical protein